jgi:hypothetical protein
MRQLCKGNVALEKGAILAERRGCYAAAHSISRTDSCIGSTGYLLDARRDFGIL